jgi:hypothetical protein
MSTTAQNACAGRIAPQKDEERIAPSVKYFTQNGMNGAYKLARPPGHFTEENCDENSGYGIGCHCDPRNFRGREDPAN